MKPQIWILFSVIWPVMSPETKAVIEPGLVSVMELLMESGIRLELKHQI